MKITFRDLATYSDEILDFLNVRDINNISSLMKGGGAYKLPSGYIQIFQSLLRRSNATNLIYILEGTGVPLELEVNSKLGCTTFTLKSLEIVQGYVPFMREDLDKNIPQSRTIYSASFFDVRRELGILRQNLS